jgi:hypothetical protein
MLFDLWWVYVVRDAARYAEGHEYAEQARRSMKS